MKNGDGDISIVSLYSFASPRTHKWKTRPYYYNFRTADYQKTCSFPSPCTPNVTPISMRKSSERCLLKEAQTGNKWLIQILVQWGWCGRGNLKCNTTNSTLHPRAKMHKRTYASTEKWSRQRISNFKISIRGRNRNLTVSKIMISKMITVVIIIRIRIKIVIISNALSLRPRFLAVIEQSQFWTVQNILKLTSV